MKVIEIRIMVVDDKDLTDSELASFAENIKDYIYNLEDSTAIQDAEFIVKRGELELN